MVFPPHSSLLTRYKKRNGRTAFAVTAVPHMDRLESELAPPFFSLLATVWLIAVREGDERPQC